MNKLASQKACALCAIGIDQIPETLAKEVGLPLGDKSSLEVTSAENATFVFLVIDPIFVFC